MGARVSIRTQKTLNYSSGNRVGENLGRGAVYRDLILRLSGSITSGTTGSNKDDIERGDEWALISRIDIIANGDQVIRSVTGEELQWLNYFWFGPRRLSTALGNNADSTSAKAFDSTLIMPFRMPGSVKPMDTALPSHLLSNLRIEVTWAATTAMDGGGGVHTTSGIKLVASSVESVGDDGPFFGSRIFRADQLSTLSSGQEKQIHLPVGNMYRGFLLHTYTSGGVDVDAIDQIVLRSGMNRLVDIKTEPMREAHLLRTNKRPTTVDLVAAADVAEEQPFISPDSKVNGWYWLDLLDNHKMSELVDTFGLSELVLETTMDATAATLDILAFEVVPIRG